jgi:hypothetical protein
MVESILVHSCYLHKTVDCMRNSFVVVVDNSVDSFAGSFVEVVDSFVVGSFVEVVDNSVDSFVVEVVDNSVDSFAVVVVDIEPVAELVVEHSSVDGLEVVGS